ncbi:Glycerophosphoryl diester phosphodiesterase family-domain-containing protein [Nemania sp. FL0916]|nr:Glycerophosphoryl diester phosphodiesterase family-domain-containing protein [Nemania sp. FL0916]
MRFGQNFHKYAIPEWDDLYVDYNGLKHLIKAPLVDDTHVQQCVIDALSRLHSFETSLRLSLVQNYDLIFSFHLERQARPATSLLRALDPDVLDCAQGASLDLQVSLQKLQWFEHVNDEAVSRIFNKLRKSRFRRNVDSDAILFEWHQMQVSMQHAIDNFPVSEEPTTLLSPTLSSYYPESALAEAITEDSPNALADYLDQNHDLQPEFYRSIFKRLALQHNWLCLIKLASRFAPTLDHHCLAVLFCSVSTPLRDSSAVSVSECLGNGFEFMSEYALESVNEIVDKLVFADREKFSLILCQTDTMGRSPLHYALKNGFDISVANDGMLVGVKQHAQLLESMLSGDKQGFTPLHLATIEGHTSAVETFFNTLPISFQQGELHRVNSVAADCLRIAIKLGNNNIVKKLAEWANIKEPPAQGPSALHLAARAGRSDYIDALINALIHISTPGDLNLNIVDSCGRTPLMDASARGHVSVVEVLLRAGADPAWTDNSGWTARRLAVHRGHLAVAELLPKPTYPLARHSADDKAGPFERLSISDTLATATFDPQKHTLVIYLGSMQLTDNRPLVQLAGISDEIAPGQFVPELHYLELSTGQRSENSQTISLPFLGDQASEPFIFQLDSETEPKVLIRLFKDGPADSPRSTLVATGATFLHDNKPLCGHQNESLIRERTIILLSLESQEIIGTVLLTFVIARPFSHLQTRMPISNSALDGRSHMALVGHRGFGQNTTDRSQLQLGENTIGSFMTAADHGATFVEVHAQVSRDLQTVIYHDFSLSETGTDIPIHELTIDQYKYASSIQTPHGSPLIASDERTIISKSAKVRRSCSFNGKEDIGSLLIKDRLKHTVDFKSKAMKPNIRGDVVQEPLVTLPELFQKLPASLGFNIEIKYPRLHEANDAGVAPIALEINLFVDTILEQIHKLADQRPIILSSFTPEICILLTLKQKAYPVLFISNAGKLPTNDFERRVSSVQAGVHFAKTWGLAGLCFASEPLMLCPELIGDVKRSGLLCASYGSQNSIPENVIIQRDAGLDMIMVDKVALIAKTLRQ